MKAVNLIPPDERLSGGSLGGRSGGGAYAVIALLLGLAALSALYASAHHEIAVKEGEASQLSSEAAQAKGEANKLAPYTHFVTLRDERVSDVQQLAGTRFDWAHLMHELGRVLPGDASLNGVQGTVGASEASAAMSSSSTETTAAGSGGSVASSTPAGSTTSLALSGCATSQAAVALTMDRLRLMDGVSEVSLQSSASSGSSTAGGSSGGECNAVAFTLNVGFEGLPTPQAPSSGGTSGGGAQSTSDAQSATSSSSEGSKGQVAQR